VTNHRHSKNEVKLDYFCTIQLLTNSLPSSLTSPPQYIQQRRKTNESVRLPQGQNMLRHSKNSTIF